MNTQITIRCPQCASKLKAQPKHIGKKLACPKCKHELIVAAPPPSDANDAEPIELLDSSSANLADLDLSDIKTARTIATPKPETSPLAATSRKAKPVVKPSSQRPLLVGGAVAGALVMLTAMAWLIWGRAGSDGSANELENRIAAADASGSTPAPAAANPPPLSPPAIPRQEPPQSAVASASPQPMNPTANVRSGLPEAAAEVAEAAPPRVVPPAQLIDRPLGVTPLEDPVPGTVFQLDRAILSYDFDELTGDLALAVRLGADEIGVYVLRAEFLAGDTAAVIGPLVFTRDKDSLVFGYKHIGEGSYLLAVRQGMLTAYNAETLQLVAETDPIQGQVDLGPETRVVTMYSSADSSDPYVLCAQPARRPRDPPQQALRVNLQTGQFGDPEDISESDLAAMERAMARNRLKANAVDPHGLLTIKVGAFGHEANRQRLEKLGRREAVPLCAMHNHPWIVMRGQTELACYDRDDAQVNQIITLPKYLQTPQPSYQNLPQTFAIDDLAHEQLIICGNSFFDDIEGMLWLLPVSEINLPDKPVMVARWTAPPSVAPGRPLTTPVSTVDARVDVQLASGPDGATLADGQLSWTPRFADVGAHQFVLQCRYQDHVTKQQHSVQVSLPPVALDFDVRTVALSRSGEYALAWNNAPQLGSSHDASPPRVALIRVRDQVPLSVVSLRQGVAVGAITADRAYLLLLDGMTLLECSLPGLQPQVAHALTATITDMEILDDRLMVLSTDDDRKARPRFHLLELPGLQPSALTALGRDPDAGFTGLAGGDWVFGSTIVSRDLTRIRSMHDFRWAGVLPRGRARLIGYGTSLDGETRPLGVLGKSKLPRLASIASDARDPMPTAKLGSLELTLQVDEISREAANRRPIVRVSVKTTSKDGESRLIPLSEFRQRYEETLLICSGSAAAMVADRKLFTFFPDDLGIVSEPTEPDQEEQRLTLRPEAPQLVLPMTGTTTVQYSAQGGKPPYRFQAEMVSPDLGANRKHAIDGLQVDESSGKLTIDGAAIATALLAESPALRSIINELTGRSLVGTPAPEIAGDYIAEVSAALGPVLGTAIQDFPVSIHVEVSVADSADDEVHWTQPLLIQLPRDQLTKMLAAEDRVKNAEPVRLPIALLGNETFRTQDATPPQPELPILWRNPDAVDVSNALRATWPKPNLDHAKWPVEQLAAWCAILSSVEHIQPGQGLPERDWKDERGEGFTGRLTRYEAGRLVFVAGERGKSLSVSSVNNQLHPSLLETAWSDVLRLRKSREVRPDKSQQRDGLVLALLEFHRDYGCLPPRAIVSDDGTPLLSWRVMILPYIGHSRLFHLFHLDEPWDSDHNRRLMQFMPIQYALGDDVPFGKTSLLALVGPRSMFPVEGVRRLSDVQPQLSRVLCLAEVQASSAVEWTRPDDLNVADSSWTDHLRRYRLAALDSTTRSSEDHIVGWWGDREVRVGALDVEALRSAVVIDDDSQ